jgi:predicted nucleotidyltransferase
MGGLRPGDIEGSDQPGLFPPAIDVKRRRREGGSEKVIKQLEHIHLTPCQDEALTELLRRLYDQFHAVGAILYGSVARGEADEESDIDLLILTAESLARSARHDITDVVFDVNLRYGTNFSTLVLDQHTWETGAVAILPVKEAILQDGIPL